MAGITALGTTYNLPNYTGELFQLSPTDTPLLSSIGGLTGGQQTTSTRFEWQGEDLRNPGQNVALEGADAPTATARVRQNFDNVVEIHQEAVAISYTKQSAVGQYNGLAIEGTNPVQDELQHQITLKLMEMARDVEYSFIRGSYQLPSDNTTPRKTRGLLEAITTNSLSYGADVTGATATASTDVIGSTGHGLALNAQVTLSAIGAGGAGLSTGVVYWVSGTVAADTFQVSLAKGGQPVDVTTDGTGITYRKLMPLTLDVIGAIVQMAYASGGIAQAATAALMVPAHLKAAISKAAAVAYGQYTETSRNVGGVDMQTIVTDFGTLNVMTNRYMPVGTLAAVSLDQLVPVFLEVPGKGHFFAEPLGKTGASEKYQLYGEVGLKYGNERAHAKCTNLGSL